MSALPALVNLIGWEKIMYVTMIANVKIPGTPYCLTDLALQAVYSAGYSIGCATLNAIWKKKVKKTPEDDLKDMRTTIHQKILKKEEELAELRCTNACVKRITYLEGEIHGLRVSHNITESPLLDMEDWEMVGNLPSLPPPTENPPDKNARDS